jgi:protease II
MKLVPRFNGPKFKMNLSQNSKCTVTTRCRFAHSADSLRRISTDGSLLFVMTNLDAPQHKLVTIDMNDEEKRIKDLIPEDKDANLISVSCINKNYFVVVYKRNASHFCFPVSRRLRLSTPGQR